MKVKVGLWIDHTKAVIFKLADEGAELKRITSESVRFPVGPQKESEEEHRDKRLTGHLNNYYDTVLSSIRDAESILLFGPGDAKVEFKKRLENMELRGHIVGIETANNMTDNQIVSKVRGYFLNSTEKFQ